MTKLLSGEEAKLAWANGEQLQVVHMTKKEWETLTDNYRLSVFDDDSYVFRLKPRTITINGIEVPAPFKPKHGEIFWHVDVREICSYNHKQECMDSDEYLQLGAWRTENEIKQVVAALRSVFNITKL